MTQRVKTVEYHLGETSVTEVGSVGSGSIGVYSSTVAVYIPEVTSRTFRSVILEVHALNSQVTAASLTAWMISINNGGSDDIVTTTVTITNSGDPTSYVFTRDVTSWFVTNFTGSTQNITAGWGHVGPSGCRNFTFKLIITYEYDDTQDDTAIGGLFSTVSTRVKTVRIPIEAGTAMLTATSAEIGTNQIPNLSTFLPEGTTSIKQAWVEWTFSDCGTGTTDFTLEVNLDTSTARDVWYSEAALNGATFGKAIVDLTTFSSWSSSSTHAIKARSNAVATKFRYGAVLYVTYTYDAQATTTVLNSLVLPMADALGWEGNTTSADKTRFSRDLWIPEPGTITLKQSGVLYFVTDPATITVDLALGAQSFRAYTCTTGSVQAGPYVISHRMDSGSASGSAITLARGRNTLTFDRYTTSASAYGTNPSAILFLNYTSDVHADGADAHSHSTCWSICDPNNALSTQRSLSAPNRLFNIPETSYFASGLAFEVIGMIVGNADTGFTLQAEVQSGEGAGAGWIDFAGALQRSDAELSVLWSVGAARNEFNRWAGDPDTSRMALETTRQYRICSASTSTLGVRAWLTHHSITFDIAGTISGSGGGTVTITAHRVGTGEKIGSTSRSGNGTYTIVWYDDTENVFVQASEDATHMGRSADDTAV